MSACSSRARRRGCPAAPQARAPLASRATLVALAASALLAVPSGASGPGYREGPDLAPRKLARVAECSFASVREDRTLSPAAGGFQLLVAGAGNVGLSVSNFGAVGNDADSRAASFEFPNGSEIEHLIRGGLWIGAITADPGDTLVSTASLSQNISSSGDATTEFLPLGRFVTRSSIPNSPDYDPNAISEQDFVASFRDFPAPNNANSEDPCPLGVEVELTVLSWSFKPVDDFVILNYTVKNVSKVDLDSVYFGMFAEFATNFKGRYENWPPGSTIFRNKVITWDDSLRLFTERHCSFDRGAAPNYGGLKILGSKPHAVAGKSVSMNWFDFSSRDIPDQDRERYLLMSNGDDDSTDTMTSSCTAGSAGNDPVEVISFGAYALPKDSSLTIAFAFVGGENLTDVELNASWAQRAFDSDYIIPQPPPSPSVRLDPGPERVTILWDKSPESIADPASGVLDFEGYRVHLSADNLNFDLVRDVDLIDSIGLNTGFAGVRQDTMIISGGDTTHFDYAMTIPSLRDGFRYWGSVTSYDFGDPTQGLPPLESGIPQNKTLFVPGADASAPDRPHKISVYPNPYRGQAAWDGGLPREKLIWFNHLPERCVIRIFTMAGDLVKEIPFEGGTYRARGVFLLDPADEEPPILSGGQAAWDLITQEDQPAASGLYFFAVEDLASGDVETGKFLILK